MLRGMTGKLNVPFLTGAILSILTLYAAHETFPDREHVVFMCLVAGAMLGWGVAKWKA